jgi:hypothetical protein
MSALVEFLFPTPAPQTAKGIVKWWESRRLGYNLIVGACGVFSYGVVSLLASLPPDPGPSLPAVACLVFGVLANVCYTFGPAAEIAIRKMWGRKVLPVGPALFREGLTFSVGLSLLPMGVAALDFGIRVLKVLF